MASLAATVEVKLSDELKDLCDRLPEHLSDRLAEAERVLIEICDRNGIVFNVEYPESPSMVTHQPVRVWQEREGEISWKCSCGAVNKHVNLPAKFECVENSPSLPTRVFRNVSAK